MNEAMTQGSGVAAPAVPCVSVKVYPVKEAGKLLAFASANLGGVFAVNNIRIYNSEKGLFVSMPSTKGKDGNYHNICCPTTREMRDALHGAVLGEYQKAVERPSVRDALQNAAKEAAARTSQPPARAADKGAR